MHLLVATLSTVCTPTPSGTQDGSDIVAHRGADPNGWLSHARTASNTAWRDFFARSSVRLPQSPLTERFFYAALYLLRLSAGGSAPPGLYGPFVTTDRMAWAGDLHLNYNLQATYYGVVQAGHEELLASYYEPLLDYRPWGRIWARRIFNCSGLALPTGNGSALHSSCAGLCSLSLCVPNPCSSILLAPGSLTGARTL